MGVGRRRRYPLPLSLVLGIAITLPMIAMAMIAMVWTPFPVEEIRVARRFLLPNAVHWLGTDHFGRDILSMIMVGAQSSLIAGLGAVALGVGGGVPLGLLAAQRGGVADLLIARTVDVAFAFPFILSAILMVAWLGPGLTGSVIALGVFNIAVFTRVARGAAGQVLRRDFVRAATAIGRSPTGIARVHVLPNIFGPIIVQLTASFSLAILAEAALSYLGLGVQPPVPSWGRMLFDAQNHLFGRPWLALPPGIAIALSVLGLSMLGDGLRDLIDPRQSQLTTALGL